MGAEIVPRRPVWPLSLFIGVQVHPSAIGCVISRAVARADALVVRKSTHPKDFLSAVCQLRY